MNAWTSWACSGARRHARADGPARLIGNHGPAKAPAPRSAPAPRPAAARSPPAVRPACAFGQALPDTQDRDQLACARLQTCGRPGGHPRPAPGAAPSGRRSRTGSCKSSQHRHRDLAGEGTLGLGADILRPQGDRQFGSPQQVCRPATGTHTAGTPAQCHAASCGNASAIASMCRAFSAREPCIFQLPATRRCRMSYPRRCAVRPKRARDHSHAVARLQST